MTSSIELLKHYNKIIEQYSIYLQTTLNNKNSNNKVIETLADTYYILINIYQKLCKYIRYKYKTKQLSQQDINSICKVYNDFFEKETSQENINYMDDYVSILEKLDVDIQTTEDEARCIVNKYKKNNIVVNVVLKYLMYLKAEYEELCNKLRYKYDNNELTHIEILNILDMENTALSRRIIPQ
jgi:hypothetical protein